MVPCAFPAQLGVRGQQEIVFFTNVSSVTSGTELGTQ